MPRKGIVHRVEDLEAGSGTTITTSNLGAAINGAAAATPNDTDLVATVESSVVKKITWTNVKAFLKSYFDTIYQAALGYTAENTANKSDSYTASSSTTYTTTKALVDGLATKQNALYLNKVTAASSAVTGTLSETQCYRVLIPANTLASGDKLVIEGVLIGKTGTANTVTLRVKVSTSSTLPAGSTDAVATIVTTTTQLSILISRIYNIVGGNLYGAPLGTSLATAEGISTLSIGTKAFDVTVDNYVYVSLQLANTGDSATAYGFTLKNF